MATVASNGYLQFVLLEYTDLLFCGGEDAGRNGVSGLNAVRAVDTDHRCVQDHVIATNDSAEDQAMMSETARLTAVPVTLSLCRRSTLQWKGALSK